MQGGVGRGIKSIRFRTFHGPQTFNVESDQDKYDRKQPGKPKVIESSEFMVQQDFLPARMALR